MSGFRGEPRQKKFSVQAPSLFHLCFMFSYTCDTNDCGSRREVTHTFIADGADPSPPPVTLMARIFTTCTYGPINAHTTAETTVAQTKFRSELVEIQQNAT